MTATINDTNGAVPAIALNSLRTELEIQNRTGAVVYYNRFGTLSAAADGIRLDDGAKLTLLGSAAQRAFYCIHAQGGGGTRTLHYIANA
jgi:hypothetical protein